MQAYLPKLPVCNASMHFERAKTTKAASWKASYVGYLFNFKYFIEPCTRILVQHLLGAPAAGL